MAAEGISNGDKIEAIGPILLLAYPSAHRKG